MTRKFHVLFEVGVWVSIEDAVLAHRLSPESVDQNGPLTEQQLVPLIAQTCGPEQLEVWDIPGFSSVASEGVSVTRISYDAKSMKDLDAGTIWLGLQK